MGDTLLGNALLRAVAAALSSSGVQPELAYTVVQNLNFEGYSLVPSTIIGASGWTPEELWAYQAGIMHERLERGTKFNVEG